MSIPSIVELAGVFENPGSARRYLVLHGALEVPEICSRPACFVQMRVCNLLKPYLYRCTRKRTCGMSLSVYKDSFFGSTRVLANKVLLIVYLWLTKTLNTAMTSLKRISCPAWLRNGAPDRKPYRALRGPSNKSAYQYHRRYMERYEAAHLPSALQALERWCNLFGGVAMQMTFGIDCCMRCSMWYMMPMLKMLRILILIAMFKKLKRGHPYWIWSVMW